MVKKILTCFLFVLLFHSVLAQQNIDVLHYRYSIRLSDASDTIEGAAFMMVVQKSTGPAIQLDLVSLNKEGKGMKVIAAGTEEDNFLKYNHANNKLQIHVPGLKKGDTATVYVRYRGVPANGLIISKNRHGDRTFFADNWPDRAHHWIPCNDRPDDKASFEFFVTAPDHYSIISNGIRVGEKQEKAGMKQTYWKESIPQPTKVMVIGAARFAIKIFADSPENIPVSAWIFPQDSAKGFYDYALAPGILKFFMEYIGDYPYKKLANVQSKTMFGGMENASAIFYSEGSVTGERDSEDLLAHEIAHQWFGNMATEKSFDHLWLSEGFATYLTNIYLENKYGVDSMNQRLEDDREEILEFATKHKHPVVDSICSNMELLNANSYQKGGWVLHMLRNEVGDIKFREIIRTYYERFKGKNAGTRDFEQVAERVSDKELTWFFDQWLYRAGIPELKMESRIQDGHWYIYITQQDEPYRFFLDFEIVDEDGGLIRERFEVKEKESVFKVPVKGNRIMFSIDPQVKLLYKLAD